MHQIKHSTKKILLFVIISVAFTYAEGQRTNKALLNGKWNLFTLSAAGYTFHKDSMQKDIEHIVLAQTPGKKINLSYKDSLKLMKQITPVFNKLFKTYARFDARGYYTLVLYGLGTSTRKTGKYEWTDDGNVVTKSGKLPPETFLINTLTADKLILTSDNDKDDKEHIELSFTRNGP